MATCHHAPRDRKNLIDRVGRELTRQYGKAANYTSDQVSQAARSACIPLDFHCWAMCVFMDERTFLEHHTAIGEACDYGAMRATMLESLGPQLGIQPPKSSCRGSIFPICQRSRGQSWT
jgi:hypothetical protein